ncbi:hypothetical protein HN748_05850 [Candidatus Peregrinibacteria bacterium]|mgnify:CR=1 FL=1|jgi:hypothetical protein|nr:hypothetical protein [Candidatus Peregrinibacteria bacterium]MBT7484359.1 hypothetical protein [Candidatus Peregrinibacteria bacterium]MBT7703730.1 hypothetical protein [Candidatus Peregrinibacteria bacterium]
MNIVLSWDLFIIVFFSVIIAYSFIVGRNQTIKIIIGTYMATLAADGVANLAHKYLGGPTPIVKFLGGPSADEILITMKIILFIIVVVTIAVRGGFEVSILAEQRLPIRVLMTFLFGVLNAGLIVSTLLLYVSGLSLIGAAQIGTISTIGENSMLVQLMIENYSLWFSLPAISLVVVSFVEGEPLD